MNEPSHVQELRERLKEIFLDFGQDEIMMTIQDINREFFKDKLERTYLQKILKEYLNVSTFKDDEGKPKLVRYNYTMHGDLTTDSETINKREVNNVGRPYLFKRKDFLSPDEDDRGDMPF